MNNNLDLSEMDLYLPETYRNLADVMGYGGMIPQMAINKLMRDSGFSDILSKTRQLQVLNKYLKEPSTEAVEPIKTGACKKKKKSMSKLTRRAIKKRKAYKR